MFNSLSYDEQLSRLSEAAEHVLPGFGLVQFDITPLSYLGNAVFAVDSRRGPFVLRIHSRQHPPPAWIESEMRWLADLNAQTQLCVPQPQPHESGAWVAWAQVEGLPEALPCVLISWLEAEPVPVEATTPEQAAQVGAFLAQLHNFSASYTPPSGFERPRLDWDGLFGDDSIYNPGSGGSIFSAGQIAIMQAVAEAVARMMQALDAQPEPFGLIHGDFIAKNVLFGTDGICALDFEYCAFGYYLYDLAPVLLGWSPLPAYADLKAALWAGYTAQRTLPDSQAHSLETFVAGRHAASCRWIASHLDNPKIRARAPQILAQRSDELRHFLETGRLERRSEIF